MSQSRGGQRAAQAAGSRREGMRGSPGRHPVGNASPLAPPSPQRRPHGRGRAPEEDGGLSRGACVRLSLTLAPPLSRRDVTVAVGACAPDLEGGGLPRPVSLVTCTPPPTPIWLGWAHNTHSCFQRRGTPEGDQAPTNRYLKLPKRTWPTGREGKAQRRRRAPSTGKVSLFACSRSPVKLKRD